MKHKHAELMALFAQDAAESDTPWDRWESQKLCSTSWKKCLANPSWSIHFNYRRKPKTININGYEVPEPIRKPLKDGETYWWVGTGGIINFRWQGQEYYPQDLASGLMHYTKEAAKIHHEAICSFTKL